MSIAREQLKQQKYGRIITGNRLDPVHPGAILLHDFIEPMGLTRYRVAKSLHVPQRRIDEICRGERAITADTAVCLGRLNYWSPFNTCKPARSQWCCPRKTERAR